MAASPGSLRSSGPFHLSRTPPLSRLPWCGSLCRNLCPSRTRPPPIDGGYYIPSDQDLAPVQYHGSITPPEAGLISRSSRDHVHDQNSLIHREPQGFSQVLVYINPRETHPGVGGAAGAALRSPRRDRPLAKERSAEIDFVPPAGPAG